METIPGLFRMFDSGKWGGKDLLFKDSTIKLVDVSARTTRRCLDTVI